MVRQFLVVSVAFVLAISLVIGAPAWAQPGPGGPPPGQGGGPGGPAGGGGMGFGFGMGMGMSMGSPFTLLNFEAVAKDLKLSDEQTAKIKQIGTKAQSEMREAYAGFSEMKQEERQARMGEFREAIEALQKATNKAYAKVLSEDQLKRVTGIYIQWRGEESLRSSEVQEVLKLSEDQRKKIRSPLEILTEDQKAAFEKLKGEKFDLSTMRMGGRGGYGGFGRSDRGDRGDRGGDRGDRGDRGGDRGDRRPPARNPE